MLQGDRIMIRPIEEEDLPIVVEWWNNAEVMYYANDNPRPSKTLEELREEYHKEITEWSEHMERFVIETIEGKLIGDILCHSYRTDIRSAVLGILIGEEEYWGEGYGTEAIRLFLKHLFEHKHLHKMSLTVSDFNHRAIRCFKKAGFRQDGIMRDNAMIDGKYVNHITMSMLEDEYFQMHRR